MKITNRQFTEYKDIERILKIISKYDRAEIETEKDSLYANMASACDLIKQELSKATEGK